MITLKLCCASTIRDYADVNKSYSCVSSTQYSVTFPQLSSTKMLRNPEIVLTQHKKVLYSPVSTIQRCCKVLQQCQLNILQCYDHLTQLYNKVDEAYDSVSSTYQSVEKCQDSVSSTYYDVVFTRPISATMLILPIIMLVQHIRVLGIAKIVLTQHMTVLCSPEPALQQG